ncbi:DMT family transporter [Streptomyces sp. Tue6028]|uniref:DMT family transporter n=1 Tax=Streptomyces sp. Tue6028 TaxID=2036037 RepID=UPI003D7479C4
MQRSLTSSLRMGALALLWGSGFLWIKLALNHGLSPAAITLTRCALGTAVLALLARSAGQRLPRSRSLWGHLVVAALFCNAIPFALFALGEQTVDSGVAGVLNATTPLWSLLIGVLLGTDRDLRPPRLTGLLLGFAGVLVIFAPWQHSHLVGWGALALLGAAASYAIAFAYMARHLTGHGAPLAVSAAQLLTATGWSTLALPAAGPLHDVDVTALPAVAVLGVFATGITFYLSYRMIADEGPTSAATVGYLLPVVSVALGALVLDERIGARVVAGMVTVLAGVALSRRARTGRAGGEARTGTGAGARTGARTGTGAEAGTEAASGSEPGTGAEAEATRGTGAGTEAAKPRVAGAGTGSGDRPDAAVADADAAGSDADAAGSDAVVATTTGPGKAHAP